MAQKLQGNRTIAKCDCKTPKWRSTFLWAASRMDEVLPSRTMWFTYRLDDCWVLWIHVVYEVALPVSVVINCISSYRSFALLILWNIGDRARTLISIQAPGVPKMRAKIRGRMTLRPWGRLSAIIPCLDTAWPRLLDNFSIASACNPMIQACLAELMYL